MHTTVASHDITLCRAYCDCYNHTAILFVSLCTGSSHAEHSNAGDATSATAAAATSRDEQSAVSKEHRSANATAEISEIDRCTTVYCFYVLSGVSDTISQVSYALFQYRVCCTVHLAYAASLKH
jgi:hypothetical protein